MTATPGYEDFCASIRSSRVSDVTRFWAGVDKTGDCWLWTRSVNSSGYGQSFINGERRVVHRIAYELLVGPIPAGLQLDHLCRVRTCVNPAHLEPVTQHQNMARGLWAMRTHCPSGHAYDDTNTNRYRGRRYCRACHRKAVSA